MREAAGSAAFRSGSEAGVTIGLTQGDFISKRHCMPCHLEPCYPHGISRTRESPVIEYVLVSYMYICTVVCRYQVHDRGLCAACMRGAATRCVYVSLLCACV